MKLINRSVYILFFGIFIFFGCNNIKTSSFSQSTVYKNGEVIDRLENGKWTYPNKSKKGLFKEGEYERGQKIGNWKYYYGENVNQVYWDKFKKGSIRGTCPSNWTIINDSTKVFLAKENKDEYAVILSQNFSDVKKYVREVYKIMLSDKEDKLRGYTMNKVVFENGKETYSGKLFTEINNIEYVNFVFYTLDNDGKVLDITYRTRVNDKNFKQQIFNDFVYGIFSNNKKLFYVDDYIASDSLIDLTKL